VCGQRLPLAPLFAGCPTCAAQGRHGVLEVEYDYASVAAELTTSWWSAPRSFWDYRLLLPLPLDAQPLTLGEGNTPLVHSERLSASTGLQVRLKNETANPTWAHKDRFHAVAGTLAAHFGFGGVATTSTSNHGASAVAYAALASLRGLVLCPPETSDLLRTLIAAYGGNVVTAPWDLRAKLLSALVGSGDARWYPSTGLDPDGDGPANPFGVEGYKTLAYEVVRQLGRAPDSVLIAVASGDTLYGVWKGFRELHRLGVVDRVPRMHGCQPSGADSLGPSVAAGLETVITLATPNSVATSTREKTSSRFALVALRESGGSSLAVPDSTIESAMRDTAHAGYCVEPASALPVACLATAVAQGAVAPGETVVCLLTAAGIKWPGVFDQNLAERQANVDSVAGFERALKDFGLLGLAGRLAGGAFE